MGKAWILSGAVGFAAVCAVLAYALGHVPDSWPSVKGIHLLQSDPAESSNYQYVVIMVSPQFKLTRNELHEALWADGILARRYFYPGCHRHKPYREIDWDLPVTEAVAEEVLCLPTGTSLSESDVRSICSLIIQLQQDYRKIRTAIGNRT